MGWIPARAALGRNDGSWTIPSRGLAGWMALEKQTTPNSLASRDLHGDSVSPMSPLLLCRLVLQMCQGAFAQIEGLFQITLSVFVVDREFFLDIFKKSF